MQHYEISAWERLVSSLPERQKKAAGRLREAACPSIEKIAIAESVLRSRNGQRWSESVARWICELIAVDQLVPEVYRDWELLISDSIEFFLAHLSPARLAQKLVDQVELPVGTAAPIRIITLLTRLPGLQKLGQVLARNRHLDPEVRSALIALENSISDVGFETVREVIASEFGTRMTELGVELDGEILSEGTVSAVVAFHWMDPESGARRRGVFKVLKPHVPAAFAEDMDLFQRLSEVIANRPERYGLLVSYLPEVFRDVRELLEHEVDFPRERRTLKEAAGAYAWVQGVRVPRVIDRLSSDRITAMTEESGEKITDAKTGARKRASQMVEALVARPLLALDGLALFHGDPHAGNLLYDDRTGELIILDWALGEHLTRAQRHSMLMLSLMAALQDVDEVCREIEGIREAGAISSERLREMVTNFFRDGAGTVQPFGGLSAVRLLDSLATQGVSFPAPLMLFRKAVFTLEGVLHDIAGPEADLDELLFTAAAGMLPGRWMLLFTAADLVAVQMSWFALMTRAGARALTNYWVTQINAGAKLLESAYQMTS